MVVPKGRKGFDGREVRTPDVAVRHEWDRNLVPSVPADPIQSLLSFDPISKLVQGSLGSSVPQVVPKAEQALCGLDGSENIHGLHGVWRGRKPRQNERVAQLLRGGKCG